MSKSFSKFPPAVTACLWSYNPDALDIRRDREEIITQVLNYGIWEAVKWVRETYSDDDIREVLKKPARGRWFKQALHFWLVALGLSLPSEIYQRAIFHLNPVLSH